MQNVLNIGIALFLAYLVGAIPFGLLIVWIAKGKDIREVASGRTGGTNAMRAAGLFAGVLTAVLDVSKGAFAVFTASIIVPESVWIKIVAGLLAIMGHNYSVFLIEKTAKGKIKLRGGAGGSTAFGGAIGFWPPAGFVILPLAILVFIFGGYASVTTISIAVIATILFGVRAALGLSSWTLVIYGIGALGLVLWSLRPNLEALRNGTERMVGLRALYQKRREAMINGAQAAVEQVKTQHRRKQENQA